MISLALLVGLKRIALSVMVCSFSYCHMHINVGAEKRPEIIKRLENAGIEAGNHSRSSIRLHLNTQDISEHRDLIADVIRGAEDLSHR